MQPGLSQSEVKTRSLQGYSSLSMLQSVKVDVIKMDKSFLDNSFRDGSWDFIVDIINIINHQKKQIVFEGVETKDQLDFLKLSGCYFIQGYYYDALLPNVNLLHRNLKFFYCRL